MKKLLLLISLALLASCATPKWPTEKFATKNNYQGVIGDLGGKTSEIHKLPMYPGGKQGINDFIMKTTRYPKQAREANLHGRVVIKYIVGRTGT